MKEKNLKISVNNKRIGESNFEELGFIDKNNDHEGNEKIVKELDEKAKKFVIDYVNRIIR